MATSFTNTSLRIATRATVKRTAINPSTSFISRPRPSRALSSKSFPTRRASLHHGATLATSSSRMTQPQPRPLRERPVQARSMFIQTESTPNEDSLKFIPGVPVMEEGGSAEFLDTRSSLASPLALRLIGIEGVKAIFYGPDFITISKDSSTAWSVLKPEIYSILMEFFSSGQPLFKSEEDRDSVGPQDTRILDTDSEVVAMIKELLDTRVRPAIMEDGGDIEYRGFNEDDGVVQVKLKGSCRGCSSSTVTLKSGIERMLMHYIPEVKGVEQILDQEEAIALDEFNKLEQRLSKTESGKQDSVLNWSRSFQLRFPSQTLSKSPFDSPCTTMTSEVQADASSTTAARTITLASRSSQLAQIQTNLVVSALSKASPETKFQTSFMSTAGDKNQSQALYLIGGKSLWTKELEHSLLDGDVDMLVHSFKDVPTVLPEGCEIAGVMEREDPVDSLVVSQAVIDDTSKGWKSLDEFADGSVIGTSSVRRVAQLKRQYPKLKFLDVRGNLNTRFAKLDSPTSPYTALILAKAGLVRLGFGNRITADLNPPTLYHAVSQGALAIEIRSNDEKARELCRVATHEPTEWRCFAERGMLRVLEGGCSVPVGVSSEIVESSEGGSTKKTLKITGTVTSLDGSQHVEHTEITSVSSRQEAEDVGKKLAKALIAKGAGVILEEIGKDRERRIAESQEEEKAKASESAPAP
ncbi:hypothetical protein NLI96_g3834 [Meripilus lineatus]|uniref:Porphobilinogen deaminase n=1 Tax=Meripilus lineatus TaxID=2056292 RepID=A0AAD5V866_9APHY|nr:hypothetical protein NLI96_g3834 [Physisporinus lineatus]